MFNIMENIMIVLVIMSSLMVMILSNPVQSLLNLMLAFALSSMLFITLGVEFMSLLIFMVYMGAMAVLFLFVMMMLNMKMVELRSIYLRYLPMGSFIVFFFIMELFYSVYLEFIYKGLYEFDYINWLNLLDFSGNMYLFGYMIYNLYSSLFLLLALILFIAMMGSIVLIVNWGERLHKSKKMYNDVYFFESNNILFLK